MIQSNFAQKEVDRTALEMEALEIENGYFVFRNEDQLLSVLQSLESMQSNEEFTKSIESKENDGILGKYPVYQQFLAKTPEFKSALLNVLEQEKQTQENKEEYTVIQGRPFASTLNFTTLLNENHEIRVGDKIYKYWDDIYTSIISAENKESLELIRQATNPFDINSDARVVTLDNQNEDDYEKWEAMKAGGCSAVISINIDGTTVTFKDISQGCGNAQSTYRTWEIYDKDGKLITKTSSGLDGLKWDAPNSGAPFTVKLFVGFSSCNGSSCEASTTQTFTPCPGLDNINLGFSVVNTANTLLSNGAVTTLVSAPQDFTITLLNPTPGISYSFNVVSSKKVVLNGGITSSASITIPTNISENFTVNIFASNGCGSKIASKTINVNCGLRDSKQKETLNNVPNTSKIIHKIWINNFWVYSEVGMSVEAFVFVGKWVNPAIGVTNVTLTPSSFFLQGCKARSLGSNTGTSFATSSLTFLPSKLTANGNFTSIGTFGTLTSTLSF